MLYKLITIPLTTLVLCELRCSPASLVVDAFGTFQVQFSSISSSHHQRISKSAVQLVRDTKWDNLVDEDDEFEFEQQGPDIPKDMRYNEFNIIRQTKTFTAIREAGGAEITNDVYVRSSESDTFWFVGKVARISDVSIEKAIARQYPLIEEHAARLRPMELYPKKGSLEIWIAPGDSEMDVAYNRPNVQFRKMGRPEDVDGADDVRNIEVGFAGEVYDSGEEGFRTWRNEDGFAKRPEIQQPEGEKRAPTDEEMEKINEMLKGQDLNDLFDKEQ